MMSTAIELKSHPWLKTFTVTSISASLLFILFGLSLVFVSPLPGLGLLTLGGIGVIAGIRTLRITRYFRQWESDISQRDRVIAYGAIFLGPLSYLLWLGLLILATLRPANTNSLGGVIASTLCVFIPLPIIWFVVRSREQSSLLRQLNEEILTPTASPQPRATTTEESPAITQPQAESMAASSFGVTQVGLPFKKPIWKVQLSPETVEFAQWPGEERLVVPKAQGHRIEVANAGNIVVTHEGKKYLFKLASQDLARLRAWLPPKPPKTVSDLKKELVPRAGGLILLAMAHFVFSNYLDPVWGGVLLGIGLLTLFISSRYMFIAIGILLMLAGAVNLFSGFGGANAGRWFGLLQIGWGIEEFTKFTEYASLKQE